MKSLNTILLLSLTFFPLSVNAQEDLAPVDSTTIYFHLSTDSAYFRINVDTAFKVFDGDSVKLPYWIYYTELSLPFHSPNTSKLDLRNKQKVDLYYDATPVYDAKTIKNNSSISHLSNINFLLSTDEDTKVFLADTLLGSGVIAINSPDKTLNLKFIQHDKVSNKSFSNIPHTFTYSHYYLKLSKRKIISYSFIPGGAQLYKQERLKALFFGTGFISLTSLYLAKHLEYANARDHYDALGKEYLAELNQEEALRLGDLLSPAKQKMKDAQHDRTLSLIGLFSFYAINVADGVLRKPKNGYRAERSLEMDFEKVEELNMIKLRYNL